MVYSDIHPEISYYFPKGLDLKHFTWHQTTKDKDVNLEIQNKTKDSMKHVCYY